jgi:hypothetical protein
MHPNSALYSQDFYAWCCTTAALIRAGKWYDIDPEALAEEIDSLGRSQKRELGSRVEVLVMHLLKWCYQSRGGEQSHSWYDTILEQRGQIQALLDDNPSLRSQVPDVLSTRYSRARTRAIGETRLHAAAFPETSPWTDAQVLDEAFWPES